MASKVARYVYTDRYSHRREFTNKRAAIRDARAEARDGWPVAVRDMRTGEEIARFDGQSSR